MTIPASTYRIQLHKGFTFADLKNIIDYLERLGVHTIYAAPILKSTPASMHGYDVTDPHLINPEIGTLDELKEISKILKSKGMMWVQDIVPNHMAFSTGNTRLMDVLERGELSPYYNYFDINWNHSDPLLKGKVLVPFLGKEAAQCIQDGELKFAFSEGGFSINYFDDHYPVSADTFEMLPVTETLRPFIEQLTTALKKGGSLDDWTKRKEKVISSFASDENGNAVADFVEIVNNDKDLLNRILDVQHYRLEFWKITERLINYRRFFTVNSLICLRMEDDDVFSEYHQFIHKLYKDGIIQGVRIDHIDGLNDPSAYLQKLRKLMGRDCYIIAEKILEAKEEMPEHWPLEGASGYEFLSYVNQLFTDRKGTEALVDFYHKLLPGMPDYEEVVLLNKRLILTNHMKGELENLVSLLFELNLQGDFSRARIKGALALVMLSVPVYRIYPDSLPLTGKGLTLVDEAFEKALKLSPEHEEELHYLHLLCTTGTLNDIKKEDVLFFMKRLMQFTGPLTAKGVEDTTFYIYNPLISHVEVGDAPSTLGISVQEYHRRMIRRQQLTPYSLNATATHDTKRGEDARVRLNVLSEIPDLWMERVTHWMRVNKGFKTSVDGKQAPMVNDEYFIYQSIIGGFPEDIKPSDTWVERLQQYIVKVVREAKIKSNWENPNEDYEKACTSFIESILKGESAFFQDAAKFMESILPAVHDYSIAQAVLKITCPGVPDIYQGCELLDLSYVDPDNRRPVDYDKRKKLLDEFLSNGKFSDAKNTVHENWNDGAGKLFATMKALNFRRNHSALFAEGEYLPLTSSDKPGSIISFARTYNDDWCIVIIPLGLGKNRIADGVFNDIFISLPTNLPQRWRNIFDDDPVGVADNKLNVGKILANFPVAVLAAIR